jgi:hypothetical protein
MGMTLTTEQQLVNLKQQAAQDAAKNLSAKTNGGAVIVPDGRNALDRYLDDVAPAQIAGRLVRFNKNAEYICADDGEKIPDTADMVALADQTQAAWVMFHGEGNQPTKIAGLIFEGFELPPRESLGNLDPSLWELGLNGKPSDPWVHQMNLPLQAVSDGQLFTFSTQSITGRKAVGTLLRHYARMEKQGADSYPIIRLKTGSFTHSDPRVGVVRVPVLAVVGKTAKDSAAKPDAADLHDEIPF